MEGASSSTISGRRGGAEWRLNDKEGEAKERLLQLVSMTTQVAIEWRVHHSLQKLHLRGFQEARGRRVTDSHPCRRDGPWTLLKAYYEVRVDRCECE